MRIMLAWLVSAILWSSGAVAAEVIRAAYEDKALPPYYMGDTTEVDPAMPGVSIELMRETAKAAGVEIEFVRMPWVRCLKSLQRGEIDMIFNASFQEDRLDSGVYPMAGGKPDPARRIATVAYSLYRLKGSSVDWTGSAITGLAGPVGAPSGYSIIHDLAAMGVKTEEAADTITNFKKLASKRIPAVATLAVSGDALLAEFPSIEKVKLPLVTKDYFVMVSHQFHDSKRALAERLWAKLAEIREHRAATIYAKYAR